MRPRLLLVVLGLEPGRAVSVEHLIDRVWGEQPPATVRKALQVHIATLRKVLGQTSITTVAGGYRLDAVVDTAEFERLVGRALEGLSADPRSAVDDLDAALRLWRDTPFTDLDQGTLVPERARLEELRLRAIEGRIEGLLAMGRHDDVVADLETITADNPYRERLRALQMLALYRAGRQADALGVYQTTRRRLVEDLGIDPSAELRSIEQRILEQDPDLEGPAPLVTMNSTLPVRRSDLVGRESDVDTLLGLLSRSRLVTLTGVGGCGKTRLGIEVAHRASSGYPGGAFFVDLTRVSDDDSVLSAVYGGIGVEITTAPTMDEVITFLQPRKVMLVVDNCEHVLDGVAEVVDVLLERCPGLTVLATSREAIAIAGETPWRVPSLAAGGVDSPAVQLFVRRARAADAAFELGEAEVGEVVEICRRLDGLPLAIELAAARTKSMTVSEVRERLDDRFRLLAGGRRRTAQRQQTLQGAVEWSYGLLNADEKAMLRRLSVFHGGFDLGDVPPVTGFEEADALDLVDSLVSKSLVDVTRDRGSIARRRLLETIRLFALDKLVTEDEAAAARERHYQVFTGTLSGQSAWEVERNPTLRERCERELDNLVAAIDWARETGRKKEAALTAARLNGPLFWSGLLPRYRDLLESDYELAPNEEAIVLVGRTSLLHSTDQRAEAARQISQRAKAIQSDPPEPDLIFAQLAEFDFAPVEGAAQRLATLDEMLVAAGPEAPRAYVAEIEIRRAGQLFSLARLEETLEASRRSFEGALSEGTTSVYWAATATIALQVVLDRRGEAFDVLDRVRGRSDIGKMTGFVGAPVVDILTGLTQIGGGDPKTAGKTLAESVLFRAAGKGSLQDGDYLALFAAFRAEIGDAGRANELLERAVVKNGHINWVVWPYVWQWPIGEFEQRNQERRHWELARLERASELRQLQPTCLVEEVGFWTN